MITQTTIQKICEAYDIGNVVSLEKIEAGVLNENFKLVTDKGMFFIKKIREKAKESVTIIHKVELLMRENGIPAIAAVETAEGKAYLSDDTHVYSVYPFIESEMPKTFTVEQFKEMGEMLGKIHTVGKGLIIDGVKQFKRPISSEIIDRLEAFKREIEKRPVKDEVDEMFLEYIELKLRLIFKIAEVDLLSDTVTHGDYHAGNILFDSVGNIIGICDWEKVEFGPRLYELGRSIIFMCFHDSYIIDSALKNIKAFVDGYRGVIEVSKSEILDGFKLRIYRMALSTWIEEKYYHHNDGRGNHFIEHEMELMNALVEGDLMSQIERILK